MWRNITFRYIFKEAMIKQSQKVWMLFWLLAAIMPVLCAQDRYEDATWGIRAFAGEKYQNFDIVDSNGLRARFRPTSKNLAGLGYSHQYFNVDIGIRLRTADENQTQRFDLQTSALFRGHYLDLIAKRYKGFVVSVDGQSDFREDILSSVIGINYLRFKNKDAIDVNALKSGRQTQKSKGSITYGIFLSYNDVRCDSTVVPEALGFTAETRIEQLRVGTAGLQVGYFHRLWLANRIYLFGALIAGAGLNFGTIQATDDYQPSFSPGIRLQAKAGAGYVRERFSVSFISDQSAYGITLDENSTYAYGLGALKLAFTWRFHSKNALHQLMQREQPKTR